MGNDCGQRKLFSILLSFLMILQVFVNSDYHLSIHLRAIWTLQMPLKVLTSSLP